MDCFQLLVKQIYLFDGCQQPLILFFAIIKQT
jgi:hypothetical protein